MRIQPKFLCDCIYPILNEWGHIFNHLPVIISNYMSARSRYNNFHHFQNILFYFHTLKYHVIAGKGTSEITMKLVQKYKAHECL